MLQDVSATAAVRTAARRGTREAGATRVLVADADAEARRTMARALRADGCEVTEVGDASVVLDAAWRERPHVLLLDAWLGPAGARSLLRRIACDPDLFRIAVVLVGGPAGTEAAIEALDQGAQDILLGDPSGPEVLARVRAARRAHDLQEQLLSRERALERLAYVDELTGLPNRRFLLRQLEAQLSRARRHGHDLAVVMVDADRFKALNDRHGHHAGDLALQAIAARLRERVRREDVVARVGGEEFVVVLPDTGADGAAPAAEDLRAAVAERPVDVGRRSVPLTISAGVAVWEGESLERLLGRADGALYAAKAAGRDRVVAAAPGRVPVSR
jgi:two-component system, cell cycle response regulator